MEEQDITVTVVGDGEVGKTCLIQTFLGKPFTGKYVPTVLEQVKKPVDNYTLLIRDTAGQEQYSRLRTLAYPQTNVFIVCFALNHLTSYKNVKTVWYPELQHHRPNAPLLLVGTKLDVGHRKVSRKEGLKLQKEIKAVNYVECSAKENTNVNHVFEEVMIAYLKYGNRKRERSNCRFL